jgi:hypothetical protein
VEHVNRPDPGEAPQAVEANRQRLQQSISESLGNAVQAQIAADARPQRNDRLLRQLYPDGTEQTEAAQ